MSLKLPDDKVVYNLPEQVGINAKNIKYLAEKYKEIDSIPAQYAELKADYEDNIKTYFDDTMKPTFTTWTTTFNGWTNTLDTYLANMSSAAVGAIAGQAIAPASIAATGNISSRNIYYKSYNMTFLLASGLQNIGLEETQRYKKAEEINGILFLVGIHSIKNTTENGIAIGSGSNGFYFTVDDATASKIYDLLGNTLTEAPNYSIISLFDVYFTIGNTRYAMPAKVAKSTGRGMYIEFNFPNITLAAGQTIYVVARTTLNVYS